MLSEINNLSMKLTELEEDLAQKGVYIDNLAQDLSISTEKARKLQELNDELRSLLEHERLTYNDDQSRFEVQLKHMK